MYNVKNINYMKNIQLSTANIMILITNNNFSSDNKLGKDVCAQL